MDKILKNYNIRSSSSSSNNKWISSFLIMNNSNIFSKCYKIEGIHNRIYHHLPNSMSSVINNN